MRFELEKRKENRNWEMGGDLEKLDEQLRGSGEAGVEDVQTQLLEVCKHSYSGASGAGENQNCLDKA